MSETIELETERLGGMCDIHDCERTSGYLWRVVDIETEDEEVKVHTALGEYCASHSQSHAEGRENLHYIGSVNRVE